MHKLTLANQQHSHNFTAANETGEKRTLYVLILTAITMVVEIVAGVMFGSMALLADGWHMGTHVAAFMITLFAYRYARRHAENPAFSFGTGKVSVLGGFASAVALAVVALVMLLESAFRLVEPHEIRFNEAIAVAVLGLIINLVSAWLLKDHHAHESHHHGTPPPDHHHHHHHHHQDHNLRAAYLHVLADALTSVLAIVALLAGKYFGWQWMDPMMGIVGAIIITRWSLGLVKQSGPILLDANMNNVSQDKIRQVIESDADNRVSDMHIWQVSAGHYAAIISLVTHFPKSSEHYKSLLADFQQLVHITIEVNQCLDDECEVRDEIDAT